MPAVYGEPSFVRMHRDHEPTPNPSKEGSRAVWPVPLLGGVRGGFVADASWKAHLTFVPYIETMNLPGKSKAPQGRRTPKPAGTSSGLWPARQRLGVRRSSAAFDASAHADFVRFMESLLSFLRALGR